MAFLSDMISQLREEFGKLDNTVEKWTDNGQSIAGMLPLIQSNLIAFFPPDSYPVKTYEQASARYRSLMEKLSEAEDTARGYLNLRFYIMLNAFLAACQESLERAALDDAPDPAALVEKSYYAPYFFDRVTLTTDDALTMLETDINRLKAADRDAAGVVLAFRIRKGIAATLSESYCPSRPALYPPVAALKSIRASKGPEVIETIISGLIDIQNGLISEARRHQG